MLAITTVAGGGLSNSLIVATSPDASEAAADDVFITRSATGNLLVATDSSFSPTNLSGNYATPSILYVTNGEGRTGPGPMQPGNNRSVFNGGPGYGLDQQLKRETTFVLRNGEVNRPEDYYDTFGNVTRETNPPGGLAAAFPYVLANRFYGTIDYDSGSWNFEVDRTGKMQIWEISPSASGVRPLRATWTPGNVDYTAGAGFTDLYAGAGTRASINVFWSGDVATVTHVAATPQPPRIREVTYTWGQQSVAPGTNPGIPGGDYNVLPSADSSTGVSFDVASYIGPGVFGRAYETGQIIGGTLSGSLFIDSFGVGPGAPPGLSLGFQTDIRDDAGGPLYFGGSTVGQVGWLLVSGSWTADGTLSFSFSNYYDGSNAFTVSSPGTTRGPVKPGPVTVTGVAFTQYANPLQPNDFTLWAGYDLPSQLWADLRLSPLATPEQIGAGSTINIDSPVIVANPPQNSDVTDIDLRATTITIDARMQSTDNLSIGRSRAGNPSETVTIDANVAVPNQVAIDISDDPKTIDDPLTVEVERMRGQLLVSQTGSIGGTFTNVPAPFGGNGLAITTENEPNDGNAEADDIGSSFRPLGNDTYLTSITGAITPANDRDFYRLTLRPFDTLQVSVYGLTLVDPVLRLETAAGVQLAFSDDYYGLNPYVRYVNNTGASQDVYVRVTGYAAVKANSGTGSYRMEATVQGAPIRVTNTVLVTANTSDVFLEGVVAGVEQSYLMRSYGVDKDKSPFVLTTTSPRTGASVGQVRGKTLQVLMANEADTPLDQSIAYNTVDIATAVDTLRVRASIKQNGTETSPSGPYPYEFTLREEDGISVDAVPASSRNLGFTSDGPMTWTAALATFGDVQIATRNLSPGYSSFAASAPITSSVGSIDIHASEMTLGSTVAVSVKAPVDPTRQDVTLTAENGSVLVNGVLRSPNGISVTQRGKGSTLVAGTGRVKTGTLAVLANAVGRSDLSPTDVQFFLRTDVDSLSADVQTGFAIDEVNDVAVSYLRSPSGLVAIRANGFDERPGSMNGPALSATLVDVGNLYVSAPNGSIDLRNDTGKRLQLGMPLALAAGTVESMKAAGNVTIITSAGGIDVYDAPFAGSGARRVDAVTNAAFGNASYSTGIPGSRASTITSNVPGAMLQADPAFATAGTDSAIGRVLRVGDRILVKNMGAAAQANGVYVVTTLGNAASSGVPAKPWILTRAADSDTWAELPTNTVVYDSDKGAYWRLWHQIPSVSTFGIAGAINVQGAKEGFAPVTTITPSLVVPVNDVRYVVSSSDGTNTGPGSLGKMIRLRQENAPLDASLKQSIAFSRLLTQPIVLREELPAIRVPMSLDGTVAARVLPAGTTAPAVSSGIVVNGQQISATQKGAALYRGTTSATVSKLTPSRVTLPAPAVFPNTAELRLGMAVAGNGIVPGTTIRAITPAAIGSSTGTVLELSVPVEAVFNPVTNLATLTLTFSTEVNGLLFVGGDQGGSAGSKVTQLYLGGFTSGAAVKVRAADPVAQPDWARPPLTVPVSDPSKVKGVTLDGVVIGANDAATPARLGNQVGVLVAGNGTVDILGGRIMSNSIAGVRTVDQAGVWMYGTAVGTQALPNIIGLDLGGKSANIGRISSAVLPSATDTFVEYNRRGMVLRAGASAIQNTQVNANSFEGISVEGGTNTIGNGERKRYRTGDQVADSNVITRNGSWGLSIKTAALALATKVYDNVFGSHPSRIEPNANTAGNVAIAGQVAGIPYVPSTTTLLDDNGNQHGGAVVSQPPTGINRPWQPRS